jgi:hypothetical protein
MPAPLPLKEESAGYKKHQIYDIKVFYPAIGEEKSILVV